MKEKKVFFFFWAARRSLTLEVSKKIYLALDLKQKKRKRNQKKRKKKRTEQKRRCSQQRLQLESGAAMMLRTEERRGSPAALVPSLRLLCIHMRGATKRGIPIVNQQHR